MSEWIKATGTKLATDVYFEVKGSDWDGGIAQFMLFGKPKAHGERVGGRWVFKSGVEAERGDIEFFRELDPKYSNNKFSIYQ